MYPEQPRGIWCTSGIGQCLTLVAGVIAGCLILVTHAVGDNESAAPPPTTSWDYGYLPQKCEVSHVFYLYNPGAAPLSVTEIKPGCSCNSVADIEEQVPPGDSIPVKVTFKSGRYLNRVKKTTKVYTDNPDLPEVHFRILAQVIKRGKAAGDITIVPQVVALPTENREPDADQVTFEVINHGSDRLSVSVVHAPDQAFMNLAISPTILPGEKVVGVLSRTDSNIPEDVRGLSTTLVFAGADTTVATLPIEIE